jgi:hypothetical protein
MGAGIYYFYHGFGLKAIEGRHIRIKGLLPFSITLQNKRIFIQRFDIRVIWYLRNGLFVLCASIMYAII